MSSRGRKTRWRQPAPSHWQHQPPPLLQWQPPFQQVPFNNFVWFEPPNLGNSATPPPPGTEEDIANSGCSGDEPPSHGDRPWKKGNKFERRRTPSNHRPFNRSLRGRGRGRGKGGARQKKEYFPQHQYGDESFSLDDSFVDSHRVLCEGNTWVDADKVQAETGADKEKAPILGSVEEREKTVKEKSEWLKNQLKNKDLRDVEMRLQQMRQRKASDQPPPKDEIANEKSLYVPASTDNSALEADSIEAVKKNLADILPDESNLLSSLLKDKDIKTRTSRCANRTEKVHGEDLSLPSNRPFRTTATRGTGIVWKGLADRRRKTGVTYGKWQKVRKTQGDSEYLHPASEETVRRYSSRIARPNLSSARGGPSDGSEYLDPASKVAVRRYSSPIARPNLTSAQGDPSDVLEYFHPASEEVGPTSLSPVARPNLSSARGGPSDVSEYLDPASKEVGPTSLSPTAGPNWTASRPKTSSESLPEHVGHEQKKENLLEFVSKLAGIPKMKDMGQLKSLIENPRPGKFEYYLKEQIKKYRLASCRVVHLSGEPFTNIESVDSIPVVKSEDSSEDDLLSSLGKWSESVNMEDLPFSIVQELGELIDFDFSGREDFGREVRFEEIELISEEPPAVRVDPLVIEPTTSPCETKPEIRIKNFARFRMPNPVNPQGDAEGRQGEADTTATPSAASHPLDGPNLMASVSLVRGGQTPSVTPTVPNDLPSASPQKGPAKGRRVYTLPQDVFYSGDNPEKKRGRCKKKSSETVRPLRPLVDTDAKGASKRGRKASGNPDSTDLHDTEQEDTLEETPLSERGRSKVSRKKMSANGSASEFTDEEERPNARMQGSDDLDEPQILSRLREICDEIKTLEKEKAHLYSLLPLARENLKRKNESSSDEGESDGESLRQQIIADMVAGLRQPANPIKSTSKKKAVKKARSGENPGDKIESRNLLPVAKGTLAFFTSNLTLSCEKDMLPKDFGIITQIKVIRKSILAASANGKVYSISSSTGKLKRTFDLGVFPVKCFTLAQTNNCMTLLIGGTENGHLYIFKLLSGKKVNEFAITNDINCVDTSWGSIFIGSKSGSIIKHHISSKKTEPLACENGIMYGINCANEGPRKILICASSKNGIEVRSAKDALVLRRIVFWHSELLGAPEFKVAIDMNMNKVCYTKSKEVHITEFTNPESTMRHKIPTQVSCMRLCNGVLFVGCKDGTIRRFDVKTNQVLEPLTGDRENVVCMDIVHDKVILARKGGVFDIINLKSTVDSDSVEEL